MSSSRLVELLRFPKSMTSVSDVQWNEIIEQGRKTHLMGQLAASLQRGEMLGNIPLAVKRHLELAALTATRRSESALWEIATIRRAVDPKISLVLLKGGAYLACADDNAVGRTFSDIDILVRRHELPAVEADLMSVGWKPSRMNKYDLVYYRNWMHEVPPMEHVRRHTVVDLHHAINPPVSRFHINPDKLFEHIEEVRPGVFVLSVTDRVIHCALHLLQEGDSKKLMRDLFDLHLLLRQHFVTVSSIEQLLHRARELKVDRLIGNAIGAAQALFAVEARKNERSGWLQSCVERAAREANGKAMVSGNKASSVMLAYSHWMKLPLYILVPHLVRKGFMRMTTDKDFNVRVA